MIKRFEDWSKRLTAILAEKEAQPFEWGHNDCLLFCADVINALTGTDYGDGIRGTYNGKTSGDEVISIYGENVTDVLTYFLGQPKAIGFANRGDAVTLEIDGVTCAGIVDETGRKACIFVEGRGLCRLPLSSCSHAWGY